MLLFCTPCPNRSQVWRPRRRERWFVIYYGGDHRVLQVIAEYCKWSQSSTSDHSRHTLSYTVHTRAAITPISPPILVIVQDNGIWYKARVEGRIQALILVDVQIGVHSDPLTGNMVTWRKTSTQASYISAHKLSLKRLRSFLVISLSQVSPGGGHQQYTMVVRLGGIKSELVCMRHSLFFGGSLISPYIWVAPP